METTNAAAPQFTFHFFRFTDNNGTRTTQRLRNHGEADGMRGLVDGHQKDIELATQRVHDWATSKGISVNAHEPYPSTKYPGKVWLEFRLGGLTL